MLLKNKFFSILTIALGVFVFSTFTIAQDPTAPAVEKGDKRVKGTRGMARDKMHRGNFGERRGKRGAMGGLRGIELTDAQKAQIKSIHELNKPDAATMAELRSLREARHQATKAAITPELKARMQAVRDQQQSKSKLMHEQIQAILTPEQRAQIDQRKTEMKQRFENRMQHRKQRPAATDKPSDN